MNDAEERLETLEGQVGELQEFGLTEGSMEIAMLRKLAFGLAGDDVDASTDDLPEAVMSAIERVEELEAENEQLRTRLDKLGDIGTQKTSKEQKIAAIVTYADNQRSPDQAAVTVKPEVIEGLVDVCNRYAYDLVDDMVEGDGENGTVGPDGYDWAHDPAELDQYGALEMDTPEKGVTVDFEGVHGAAVPLNKFINGSPEKGVGD